MTGVRGQLTARSDLEEGGRNTGGHVQELSGDLPHILLQTRHVTGRGKYVRHLDTEPARLNVLQDLVKDWNKELLQQIDYCLESQ